MPPGDLDRTVQLHLAQGGSFAEILIQESILDEDDLFFLMSRRLGVPAIPEERLLHLTLSPELQIRVPQSFARAHILVPLDLDRSKGLLSVAIFDPTDWDTLELLRESSKVAEIKCYLARRRSILEALESTYTEEADPQQIETLEQLPVAPLEGQQLSHSEGKDEVRFTPANGTPEPELMEKVEIDPSLAQEIAILSGQGDQQSTLEISLDELDTPPPLPRPLDELEPPPPLELEPDELDTPLELEADELDTPPPLELEADELPPPPPLELDPEELDTPPPLELEPEGPARKRVPFSESVTLVRKIEGRSLLGEGRDEEGTNPFGSYPPPDDPGMEYVDYQVSSSPQELDSLPEPSDRRSPPETASGSLEQPPPASLDSLVARSFESLVPPHLDAMPTVVNEVELEDEITSVTRVSPHQLEHPPLPDVNQMEELDSLLRELLSSVGVLVSMLEERIDPVGGSYREYGRISRLVSRELGMDEGTISRISLAAHLYGLDIALRSELGINAIPDVTSTFSAQPSAPGGLGPSLRMLGAKALGITEEGEGESPGVFLIRLVADYLELSSELEEGAHDVETVAQLLRTGGGDPLLIDALVRAMESAKTSRRRITPSRPE